MKTIIRFLGLMGLLLLGGNAVAQYNYCEEGGPYNQGYSCITQGSVNSPGSLTFSSVNICIGGTVTTPTATGVTFTDGVAGEWMTYDCPENSPWIDNQNTVTYSAGNLHFTRDNSAYPQITGPFNTPGTYTYTAIVDGVPSDGACATIVGIQVGTLTVVVRSAPSITTQPTNASVVAGNDVSFTVAATGSSPLTYQWYANSNLIAGATNAVLSLTNVQLSQAGYYMAKVTNTCGVATSSNAVLSVSCLTAPSGLVSFWTGESNANDLVGGNAGTVLNGAGYAPGISGFGFTFNGSNGHVRIPDAPNLHFSNGFTIEAWIFPTNVGGGIQHGVAGKWDTAIDHDARSYAMVLSGDGYPYLTVSADGTASTISTAIASNTVPTNQWSHLAGTYDGTNICVYVNGSIQGVVAAPGGAFPGSDDFSIGALVGGEYPGGFSLPFAGRIDEVSTYGRALSNSEIFAIYRAGAAGKCRSAAAPVVYSQPANRSVPVGANVILTVGVSGSTPLNYQWRLNGTNLSGATNATLTMTNVQLSQAGDYSVAVTNLVGTTLSSNASMVVNSPVCVAAPSGLISWWRAESNANDSLSGNNGVFQGGATYATGEVGNAFSFNGTNQYVEITNGATLNPGGSFSIEGWIFAGGQSPAGVILGKWGDLDDYYDERSYLVTLNGRGALGFYIADAAHQRDSQFYTFHTFDGVVTTNAWTHVAAVYDQSTGKRVIYVNGVKVAERVDSPIVVLNVGTKVGIGARLASSSAVSDFFAGKIDELSLYDRALSASEIQMMYTAGTAGTAIAPTVVTQPSAQSVTSGADITMSVTTAGTAPIDYQWRLNGTNISGATNASLVLTNVQPGQSGNYSVVVTNTVGSATSSNAVLTVSPPTCVAAPSGLITWWRAESNANDSVSGNNGTFMGGAAYVTGQVGQSFSLNGTNQYVEIPASPTLNLGGSFTIEGWIYAEASSSSGVIVGKWGDIDDYYDQRCYSLWLAPEGAVGFGIADANHQWDSAFYTFRTSDHAVETNSWTHVAAVYDQSTGKRSIFVNGAKVAERTDAPVTILAANTKVGIGARLATSSVADDFFAGRIDEISIFGQALAATNIQAIYLARSLGKCNSPIGPWILVQPQGRTVMSGSDVTNSVVAAGTTPLAYQWRWNGANISGATNASLVLTNVQPGQSGNYSVVITNAVGSVTSSNAPLTVYLGVSGELWAVNFYADKNPTLGSVKTGLAAVGHTTNDFWNGLSRDGATMYDWLTFVAATNLSTVDGASSGVGLSISNAPGAWFNGADDAMYNTYLYPFDGSNIAVVVTNLPVGIYDFYVYGHGNVDQGGLHNLNGVYELFSGTNGYGRKSTATTGTNWESSNWEQGEQYVVFAGVRVTNGQPVVLTGLPGEGGEALIAGLQIAESHAVAPTIISQPLTRTNVVGTTATFAVQVIGTDPFTYQWQLNGTNITEKTNFSLILTNVQLSQSGTIYSVLVGNTVGSTNSSNAVLIVNPPPACLTPPAGIVSWWPSESNANDVVGAHHGTLYSNASYATGKVGIAFSLDGTNSHIRVSDTPSLRLTTNMTLEAWVFPTRLADGVQHAVISKWDAVSGPNQRGYCMGIDTAGHLYCDITTNGLVSGATTVVSAGTLSSNQWSHVAVTFDGTNIVAYINGAMEASQAASGTIFVGTNDLGIGEIVGGAAAGQGVLPFAGRIDEPTVYNRTLSASQLMSAYLAGSEGKCNDTDSNGLNDTWEIRYFGATGQDPGADPDGDGLTNLQEYMLGTDPTKSDTDGDGLTDAEEVAIGLDPLNPDTGNTGIRDGEKDSDHDGISNLGELRVYNSDPAVPNYFDSATLDLTFLKTASPGDTHSLARVSPPSTSGNILTFTMSDVPSGSAWDLWYVPDLSGTPWRIYAQGAPGQLVFVVPKPPSPSGFFQVAESKDTDGDGLTDGFEAIIKFTNPDPNIRHTTFDVQDSDGDGMSDGLEVELGRNPLVKEPNYIWFTPQ